MPCLGPAPVFLWLAMLAWLHTNYTSYSYRFGTQFPLGLGIVIFALSFCFIAWFPCVCLTQGPWAVLLGDLLLLGSHLQALLFSSPSVCPLGLQGVLCYRLLRCLS